MLRRYINYLFTIILFIVVMGVVAGSVAVGLRLREDTASQDADAIIGGRLEEGYPAAAFLLNRSYSGGINECGAAILGNGRAVTAAHCVDNQGDVFIGIDRPDAAKNLVSTSVNIHPGWASTKSSNSDLAVVTLADTRDTTAARVTSPEIGCDYVIVGYGQDQVGINGLRKSADVCIEEVDGRTVLLKGEDGTACFGDSGSPVFRRDTNEVVAVVSQILTTADNPCAPTDTIRATRIDANINSIFAPNIEFAANNVDQPLSLDLRLISQDYLGNNRYNVEISGEILNNTKDVLSEVIVDWCTNSGTLEGHVESVDVDSLVLTKREGYGEDDDCRIFSGVDSIEPFSKSAFGINAVFYWDEAGQTPIDMLVSATVGDNYRVFSLSNDRDISGLVPNSSTLLVTLRKPIVNADNEEYVRMAAIVGGVLLVLLALLKLLANQLKYYETQ